jgi:hypothetical protein
VEYKVVNGSKLVITDTPMGAGDGKHAIRSGTIKIQHAKGSDGPAPGAARLLDLRIATDLTVEAGLLGVKAKVTTKTRAQFTPDNCGVVAKGVVKQGVLHWFGPARGYRSWSTILCEGALCGRFGGPPEGKSKMQHGPYPVKLQPLKFSHGVRRLSMALTRINHTDSPKQTTFWTLEGSETKRSCVAKPACK